MPARELDSETLAVGAGAAQNPVDDPWACLAELEARTSLVAPVDDGQRWVYSLRLLSLATGAVPPELKVRVCGEADPSCQIPILDALDPNPQGWVDVPLNEGFTGYLEVVGPTIVPNLIQHAFLSRLTRGLEAPHSQVDRQVLPALSQAAGEVQRDDEGLLAVRVFGCDGMPAAGIRIRHDRGGAPWYFVDGLPTSEAQSTSEEGLGGFLNVPEGVSVVELLKQDSTPLLNLRFSVLIRAGWVTTLRVNPSRLRQ